MAKMKGFRRRERLAAYQGGVYVNLPVLVAPCFYCEFWYPVIIMTTEHVENLRDGGHGGKENLRLTCHDCNAGRQHLTKAQKLRGLRYVPHQFNKPVLIDPHQLTAG